MVQPPPRSATKKLSVSTVPSAPAFLKSLTLTLQVVLHPSQKTCLPLQLPCLPPLQIHSETRSISGPLECHLSRRWHEKESLHTPPSLLAPSFPPIYTNRVLQNPHPMVCSFLG